jgi:hypothetical protein
VLPVILLALLEAAVVHWRCGKRMYSLVGLVDSENRVHDGMRSVRAMLSGVHPIC